MKKNIHAYIVNKLYKYTFFR